MAFAIDTFRDVRPVGRLGFGSGKTRKGGGIGPGTIVAGAGVVAFSWIVATVITTQTMVLSIAPHSNIRADDTLSLRAAAPIAGVPVQRSSRMASYSNMPPLPNIDATAPQTTAHMARIPLPAALVAQFSERMLINGLPAAMQPGATQASTFDVPPVANLTHLADALRQQSSQMALTASAAAVAAALQTAQAGAVKSLQHPVSDSSSRISAPQADFAASADASAVNDAAPVSAVRAEEETTALALADPSASTADLPSVGPIPAEEPSSDARESSDDPEEQPTSPALASAEASLDDVLPETVPLPLARPRATAEAPAPAAEQDDRPPSRLLAYAKPNNPIERIAPAPVAPSPVTVPNFGSRVAIYDIEAKTVYLPSGERLEAHSGLGVMQDNPRYVNQKNRGPTPPHTYDLTLRESLFHGVEAIRLNPTDGGNLFGRDGLLAHTYMLGPRGASNGCVSFKDYRRFLKAFKNGEVRQLVVVPRLSTPPKSRFASLFSRGA